MPKVISPITEMKNKTLPSLAEPADSKPITDRPQKITEQGKNEVEKEVGQAKEAEDAEEATPEPEPTHKHGDPRYHPFHSCKTSLSTFSCNINMVRFDIPSFSC